MSIRKTSGVTISFTKDEVDWLAWVMTDVLGKATHVPAHDTVKTKITDALQLIQDIDAVITGGEVNEPGRTEPRET